MTKEIRAYDQFGTNIKGLPDGEYMTRTGYSDTHPYKVVSRTAKTVTVAQIQVKRDPDWKPEFYAGGFAGHCSNQSDQTWLYDGINEHNTLTLRLRKSPYFGSDKMWGNKRAEFIANGAREFYDYNY